LLPFARPSKSLTNDTLPFSRSSIHDKMPRMVYMSVVLAESRIATFVVAVCALSITLQPALAQQPVAAEQAKLSVHDKLRQTGDLKLRNTPVSEALAGVAKIWNVNISSSADLQGVVSSTHAGSTLGEVLQAVLLPNGYSYQIIGNTIVVVSADDVGLQNPLFRNVTIPLQYTSALEIVTAAQHLVSPQGKVEAIESANALLVIDFPERITAVQKFVKQMEQVNQQRRPTGGLSGDRIDVAHVDLQYVKAETILKTVEAALGKDGKVAIDIAENRLVMKDNVANLAIVEKLIEHLDIPRPQVRITALIYDVGLRDLEEIGVNWNSILKFDFDADGTPRQVVDLESVQRVPFLGSPIDAALTVSSMNKYFDLTAVVSALSEADDSRLLADPMITVLNNEEAKFQSVEEIPYQELTETSAGGNIGTTSFKEVGIELNVIPQIAADGTVQLSVNPIFSRLAGFTPNTDQPIIDRRETSTHVRVADGQTFVLGGMRRRTETHSYTGVPFLKDIQFLHIGKLFRSRDNEIRESELLVFIKTDIVTPLTKKMPREEMADHAAAEMLNQVPAAADIWPVEPFGFSAEEELEEPLHEQPQAESVPLPNESSHHCKNRINRRQTPNQTNEQSQIPRTALAHSRQSWPSRREHVRQSVVQRSPSYHVVTRLPHVETPALLARSNQQQATLEVASLPSKKATTKPPQPRPSIWLARTLARK
jgi:general secretion pathway protein D